ncbi:MAG TPA: hypothetical protein VLW26_00865 [Steroidobacteraceae bacterium]|nr:hypothetical protein [Steroidobacteraceae bacterium]
MRTPKTPLPAAACAAVLLALSIAGCSSWQHWYWPFSKKPPPAPEISHDLTVTAAPDPAVTPAGDSSAPADVSANYPEYWKRNTLVVDLQAASGSGGIVLQPRSGVAWPVRLAFRVRPGSIGQLEVIADQRTILPIAPGGTHLVDLELAPGIYTSRTEKMRVSWGPVPAQ